MSANPVTLGNLDVAVGGVTQTPGIDYLLVDGVLAFTSAPPNGVTILARFGEGIASGPSMDSYDVRFRQAGTGAVDRTAEAKMRDVVSVKDFGAVGNGVADDTAAIQSAIDYAESLSVYLTKQVGVWFPYGVYNTSATLGINTAGSAIVLYGDGFPQIAYSGTGTCLYVGNDENFGMMTTEVHNLSFKQRGTAKTGLGLLVRGAAYSVFKNLGFEGFNTCVDNFGSIGVMYDFDKKFIRNCEYGFILRSSQPQPSGLRYDSNLVTVKNVHIAADTVGIRIEPTSGVTPTGAGGLIEIDNCIFESMSPSALASIDIVDNGEVQNLDQVMIYRCWFEIYGRCAVKLRTRARAVVSHCFVAGCTESVFVLEDNQCQLDIEYLNAYFGDAAPVSGNIIDLGGTATAAALANCLVHRCKFYPVAGNKLYFAYPLNPNGILERQLQTFAIWYGATYPSGNNENNWGLTLTIFDQANRIFGEGWKVAEVCFAGNDGTSTLGYACLKLYQVGNGYRVIDISGAGATGYTLANQTASTATITFNNDGSARWRSAQGIWRREL